MRDDFAAFVLTHGRPGRIRTLNSLERSGYTGRTYLVIDDEDETGDEYRDRYGDQVVTFSKTQVGETFDLMDTSTDRRSIVWARNACWQLARDAGCRYFVQLDDDYTSFQYRRPGKRYGELGYHGWTIRRLDDVFESMIGFLEDTPALTLAMSQGGDHIGGADSQNADAQLRRKAMNSFVLDTERPFQFPGRINEDVTAYVTLGALGHLLLTYTALQLTQLPSQSNAGGMTDMYLDSGTYIKAMFTVIAAPSCVTINKMGNLDRRLHHRVQWRNAVPKILHEHNRRT